MNMLRQHLALIIPLLALLFSFQSILLIDRAVEFREDGLLKNYSIVVASKTPLDLGSFSNLSNVSSISEIDPTNLLKKFENLSGNDNILELKKELPLFYSIKLKTYPSKRDLDRVSEHLKSMDGILRIENFSKTQDQIYKLLLFMKSNISVFGALLGIFSLLLMVRQIQIWQLQYQKRFYIMDLLGAGFWLKNSALFKMAFLDSLIAALSIQLSMLFLASRPEIKEILENLGVSESIFHFSDDLLRLILLSLVVSFVCVNSVIMFQRKN